MTNRSFLLPKMAFLLLAVLSNLSGCSKSTDSSGSLVTGKVEYKGAGVPSAQVAFIDTTSGVHQINTREDGSFETKDLPPGTYDVTVSIQSMIVPTGMSGANGKMTPEQAAQYAREKGYPVSAPGVAIPTKYANKATSKLTAAIVTGKNPPLVFSLAD